MEQIKSSIHPRKGKHLTQKERIRQAFDTERTDHD